MHIVPELYTRYFVEKDDERIALFKILKESYNPVKGLYPGSFVHVTPSFFIKEMTYVDSDRRISKFFNDPALVKFIDSSIAFTDTDYKLIGVLKRNGKVFRLVENGLADYFIKKNGSQIDTVKVLEKMIGESFTKTGYAYVFEKII